jgi:hypothetical protein
MTDTQARARVWTLCLAALVLCALTGPVAGLLTPLAHASAPALTILAAVLAAALIGTYVALAVLLILAVPRVVRPQPGVQRPQSCIDLECAPPCWPALSPTGRRTRPEGGGLM